MTNLPEKPLAWGQSRSCIRDIAEYGARRRAEIGEERVFDFSIGSPSVPAPPCVHETLADLLQHCDSTRLHAYTDDAGLPELRAACAAQQERVGGVPILPKHVYICCGASAGLAICAKALLRPGDEAVLLAPYFPEYEVFLEGAGGVPVIVPPDEALQPDFEALARALTAKTRLLLLNTPNNPSGVVLTEASLRRLGRMLDEAQARFGHPIYLVSDEPYRELVYEMERCPSILPHYGNTVVCYSYSKSLSLPGERIGYLAVSSRMQDADLVYDAIDGAGRAYGYACAPSLMQYMLLRCLNETADISVYRRSRDLLYEGLTALGFACVKPDGAFYLFVKTPEPDAKAFCERAKRFELLLVPGDDFGVTGYVRIAYCVDEERIRRAMPAFRALAADCGLI